MKTVKYVVQKFSKEDDEWKDDSIDFETEVWAIKYYNRAIESGERFCVIRREEFNVKLREEYE